MGVSSDVQIKLYQRPQSIQIMLRPIPLCRRPEPGEARSMTPGASK